MTDGLHRVTVTVMVMVEVEVVVPSWAATRDRPAAKTAKMLENCILASSGLMCFLLKKLGVMVFFLGLKVRNAVELARYCLSRHFRWVCVRLVVDNRGPCWSSEVPARWMMECNVWVQGESFRGCWVDKVWKSHVERL